MASNHTNESSSQGSAGMRESNGMSSDAGNAGASGAMPTRSGKSERGFASMDKERQRQIASQGGRAAHRSGNAHEFTSEEAREAGRKGGQASGTNRAALRAAAQTAPSNSSSSN